jgi:hypothetical protein
MRLQVDGRTISDFWWVDESAPSLIDDKKRLRRKSSLGMTSCRIGQRWVYVTRSASRPPRRRLQPSPADQDITRHTTSTAGGHRALAPVRYPVTATPPLPHRHTPGFAHYLARCSALARVAPAGCCRTILHGTVDPIVRSISYSVTRNSDCARGLEHTKLCTQLSVQRTSARLMDSSCRRYISRAYSIMMTP